MPKLFIVETVPAFQKNVADLKYKRIISFQKTKSQA